MVSVGLRMVLRDGLERWSTCLSSEKFRAFSLPIFSACSFATREIIVSGSRRTHLGVAISHGGNRRDRGFDPLAVLGHLGGGDKKLAASRTRNHGRAFGSGKTAGRKVMTHANGSACRTYAAEDGGEGRHAKHVGYTTRVTAVPIDGRETRNGKEAREVPRRRGRTRARIWRQTRSFMGNAKVWPRRVTGVRSIRPISSDSQKSVKKARRRSSLSLRRLAWTSNRTRNQSHA